MSELREKIAGVLEVLSDEYLSKGLVDDILSRIDSSPVDGLEIFRKCDNCNGVGKKLWEATDKMGTQPCYLCHGTGNLVRPMTRGELETWAKQMLKTHYALPSSQYWVILLPSGGRIRVKP